jgi:hypothetical protein
MVWGVLGELDLEDGDADVAAEHAHQGADRGSLGQDVVRQAREREQVERQKSAAEPKTLGKPGEQDRSRPHVERKPGHLPQRGRGQEEPDQDEPAVVDPIDTLTRHPV